MKEKDKHYLLNPVNESGFKKKHLAKLIGVTEVELSHYLHGTRDFPKANEDALRNLLRLG
mgnify:CR=1 FL=1